VLIYHPLKSEPDVRPLLAEARQQILLPRVTPEGLDIHRFTSTDSLLHSSFGTFEPDPERCPRITLDEIDLAIIPGVAFDPCTRVRLGRGGGYYDRLLANPKFSATTIGIAFDLQLHEGLPSEPHDQAVDHLLTENGLR
jgi:5-formyltetrahydrofolate cyclo-ligase